MFNNLIESNLHTSEFKRRGSFLLYTMAAYGLLFAIAGVGSIYAYDANLDEQETLEITMLPPVDLPGPPKPPENHPASAPQQPAKARPFDVRPVLIASINRPDLEPPPVSAKRAEFLPMREGVTTVIGSGQSNAILPGGSSGPGGPGGGPTHPAPPPLLVDLSTLPAPIPPKPTPPPPVLNTRRVMNSEALSLPKPVYPTLAKQARASGTISVQILIDEKGRVISAHALGGNPLLTGEAVRAALQARFSPTTIGDTPVKVSGLINYNFVLQ